MRIEQKFSLLCALAMLAQIFTISSIPFEIAEPWDKVWHPGADSATRVRFSRDVILEGKPLPAGEYQFICSIHPTLMVGTLKVQ